MRPAVMDCCPIAGAPPSSDAASAHPKPAKELRPANASYGSYSLGERSTVEYAYEPHLYIQARRYVVEEICNTLPARSLNDLRARGAWLAFQADAELSQAVDEHRTLIATLRADIERMGARLREQDAAPVQSGQARLSRTERRAAVLALLAEGLGDREVARRLGISSTTVGAIRKNARGVEP